jgi:hypothetical protein
MIDTLFSLSFVKYIFLNSYLSISSKSHYVDAEIVLLEIADKLSIFENPNILPLFIS